MKLKPCGKLFLVLFIIAAGVMVRGIYILWKVDSAISDGVKEATMVISDKDVSNSPRSSMSTVSKYETYDIGDALAVLTFVSAGNSRVGVFNGMSNEVLKKGAGRDINSSLPNTPGNCVLYAHRDSGFNPLTSIACGDVVALETSTSNMYYRVISIDIFDPEDPKIYARTNDIELTLVTCYPFHFVGPAPKRCVVRAVKIISIKK